jgi:hypothetical protein
MVERFKWREDEPPIVWASDYDALAADAQRDYDGMREFQAKFIAADHRIRELEAALRAVLLFHGASQWTPDVCSDWKELTGTDEATTRTLCDTVRAALGKLEIREPSSARRDDQVK